MNSSSRRLACALWVFVLILATTGTTFTQTQITGVTVDIRLQSYDVIYVADMFDVATGSISNAIPNVSFTLTPVPASAAGRVRLKVTATVQLKGDPAPLQLVTATTNDFDLVGFLLVSSRDLASTSGNIRVNQSITDQNTKERLKTYITTFPTAPVGTYTIRVDVINANNGITIGSQSQTVEVKNSSVADVSVTLLDPQEGSVLSTVLPTFAWITEKPTARVKIFEKLPQYQSPQDAISGIPHLVQDVNGSTLTYPPDARKLEPGKTYYWFVETDITSNRGTQTKQSEIRMFRVSSANVSALLQMIERLFTTYGGDLATNYAQMQDMGLQFTGEIAKDGTRITREELAQLFDYFVTNNTKLLVRVE
jgi:hypothetical protein